jgi:uncharacterized membrane protein
MTKRKKRSGATPAKRASSKSGHGSAAQSAASKLPTLDKVLLALCGAGIVLTGYLTYTAWFGEHPRFCSEGSDCELVQSSRWSTLLGVPMAFWGLLTYAVLARLVWRRHAKASLWPFTLFVATCGFAISTYLTSVSVFQIEALCMYCLTSYGLISAILVLVALRKPADQHQFPWVKSFATPLLSALLIIAALHMHFSGMFNAAAGPEKPAIAALADHLTATDAKFYGAFWCPRCLQQKDLFEASVKRLPYVECSPQGRQGPANAACTIRNIRDYPTWIVKGKRHTGTLSLERLADLSDFEIPEGGF